MMWFIYSIGAMFMIGILITSDSDDETFEHWLGTIFLFVFWPLGLGILVGDILKKKGLYK